MDMVDSAMYAPVFGPVLLPKAAKGSRRQAARLRVFAAHVLDTGCH